MKNIILLFSILLISAPSMLYGQGAESEESLSAQIEAVYTKMAKAAKEKNAAELASHFAEDVFFKLPGQQPVHSRMGVQKVHEGMFKQGMGVRFETTELQAYGDIAVEIGTADIIAPDGSTAARTMYLTNWKKIDGTWKIYRDVVSALPAGK